MPSHRLEPGRSVANQEVSRRAGNLSWHGNVLSCHGMDVLCMSCHGKVPRSLQGSGTSAKPFSITGDTLTRTSFLRMSAFGEPPACI